MLKIWRLWNTKTLQVVMHDQNMHWLHKHQNALVGIIVISVHLPMQHTVPSFIEFSQFYHHCDSIQDLRFSLPGLTYIINALWVSWSTLRSVGGHICSKYVHEWQLLYDTANKLYSKVDQHQTLCWWRLQGIAHKLWHNSLMAIWPRDAGLVFGMGI